MVAREIFAKSHPDEYAWLHSKDSEFPEIPLSPEELLRIHRENVADFSQIDQMVSGKGKHILRNVDVLASSVPEHINRAYNNMITAYKTVYGEGFKTLEDQGIHIDYSNVEANKAFLKNLGMIDDDLITSIAESPEKMKFLAEEFAYQRSTANRSITYSNLPTEAINEKGFAAVVEDAINTNASYSNYAGNWARFLFGGSSGTDYAGKAGVVSSRQFPIRNTDKINTVEDLFNEFARFSTSPEGKKEAVMQKNFPLNDVQIEEIRSLLQIPKTVEIKTLNDVLPFTVPNRNVALPTTDTLEGRRTLSEINNKLADIIGMDYTYSAQEGFDDSFFGVYRSEIPDATTVSQYITDQNALGFELPHVGLSQSIKGRPFVLDIGRGWFPENSPQYLTQRRKLETAGKVLDNANKELGRLGRETQRKIGKLSKNLGQGAILFPLEGFATWLIKHIIDDNVEQKQMEQLINDPEGFKYNYEVTDSEYNALRRDYYNMLSDNESTSEGAYRALKYNLHRLKHRK